MNLSGKELHALYKNILVTLDTTPTDRAIIDHVKPLAKLMQSRVILLHVATSALARWRGANAAGEEVEKAQAYLNAVSAEFGNEGIPTQTVMRYGDPVKEIVRWVEDNGCDIVAMSTHGHQFMADLFYGSTANPVQHSIRVPVLLVRAR